MTCSHCGKPLTDPASIARGVGPECAERANHGGHTRAELVAAIELAEKLQQKEVR